MNDTTPVRGGLFGGANVSAVLIALCWAAELLGGAPWYWPASLLLVLWSVALVVSLDRMTGDDRLRVIAALLPSLPLAVVVLAWAMASVP